MLWLFPFLDVGAVITKMVGDDYCSKFIKM